MEGCARLKHRRRSRCGGSIVQEASQRVVGLVQLLGPSREKRPSKRGARSARRCSEMNVAPLRDYSARIARPALPLLRAQTGFAFPVAEWQTMTHAHTERKSGGALVQRRRSRVRPRLRSLLTHDRNLVRAGGAAKPTRLKEVSAGVVRCEPQPRISAAAAIIVSGHAFAIAVEDGEVGVA